MRVADVRRRARWMYETMLDRALDGQVEPELENWRAAWRGRLATTSKGATKKREAFYARAGGRKRASSRPPQNKRAPRGAEIAGRFEPAWVPWLRATFKVSSCSSATIEKLDTWEVKRAFFSSLGDRRVRGAASFSMLDQRESRLAGRGRVNARPDEPPNEMSCEVHVRVRDDNALRIG